MPCCWAWRHEGTSEDELMSIAPRGARKPVIGFYLQRAVGGIPLSRSFWTRFAAIDNVIAIKVAPFDRYKTLDVAFGVVAARAEERITLYTETMITSWPTLSRRSAFASASAR